MRTIIVFVSAVAMFGSASSASVSAMHELQSRPAVSAASPSALAARTQGDFAKVLLGAAAAVQPATTDGAIKLAGRRSP